MELSSGGRMVLCPGGHTELSLGGHVELSPSFHIELSCLALLIPKRRNWFLISLFCLSL